MPLDQTANFQRAEITDGFPMAAADDDIYFVGADEFPDPANGEYNLVVFDQTQFARPDQDPNVEIVRATSRLSSFELAVDRAQEGTSAADHPAGSAVLLAATSKVFDDVAATDQPVENFSSNSTTAGEVLTSNGDGSLQFSSVGGIEEVSTFGNLPAVDPPQIGYVADEQEYYFSKPTFGVPFDISAGPASFTTSINTPSNFPADVTFNNNGSRLYTVGKGEFHQFTVLTPFDISTALFDTSSPTQDSFPTGMAFSSNGTRLFEVGTNNNQIYQFNLSTPFDISSASFDASSGFSDLEDITFNNNGSKLYLASDDNDDGYIYEYSLPSNFDITSRNYEARIDSPDNRPRGIVFSSDGSRLYVIGWETNLIHQSNLSTPFDINTASFNTSINHQDNFPTGIALNNDGSRLYEVGATGDRVYQSTVSSGGWVKFE
jgi:hypothetical protein